MDKRSKTQLTVAAGDVLAEIRCHDGVLDEVVATRGVKTVHIERMDRGAWWLRVQLTDGRAIVVRLCAQRQAQTDVAPYWEGE
jgi:hypothetical protein